MWGGEETEKKKKKKKELRRNMDYDANVRQWARDQTVDWT